MGFITPELFHICIQQVRFCIPDVTCHIFNLMCRVVPSASDEHYGGGNVKIINFHIMTIDLLFRESWACSSATCWHKPMLIAKMKAATGTKLISTLRQTGRPKLRVAHIQAVL